ncbi:MAG: thioredoxin domain-containing protein [Gemmatimonadetes bacterium]|nr:thioredoxin domain-containing protein [Gemmatimonadota bacterium]
MVAATKSRPSANFYVLLAVIVIGGAGVLLWMATRAQTAMVAKKVDPTLLAQTKAEGYLLGNPAAPIQIAEFGDFECPQCGLFNAVTEPDVRKHLIDSGYVALRYYDYPLTQIHANTLAASHAAACANAQGKFWEMHDRLFQGQMDWNGQATSNPTKVLKGYAQELGLDVGKWEQCYDAQQFVLQIEASRAEGDRRRITGTPTFFINDRMLAGNITYDQIRKEVDAINADIKKGEAARKGKPQ